MSHALQLWPLLLLAHGLVCDRHGVAGRLQQNKSHADRRPVRVQVATKVTIVAHETRVLEKHIKQKLPFGFVSRSVQIPENSLVVKLRETTEVDHVKLGLRDILRIKINETNGADNITNILKRRPRLEQVMLQLGWVVTILANIMSNKLNTKWKE